MKLLLCSLIVAGFPLRHLSVTSPFGYRIHPVTGKYTLHAGIDLRARSDTVFAVLPGTVEAKGFDPLLGIFVRLKHGDIQTIYGHLSRLFVFKGDTVTSATELGVTGSTGRVTGEHLHFEVKFHGTPIDPLVFLTALSKRINNNLIIK